MAEAKKAVKKTKAEVEKKPAAKKEVKEMQDGDIQESNRVETEADQKPKQEVKVAKAGKRSIKALKEAEEKQAKEERRAKTSDSEDAIQSAAPKQKQRTAEDRLKKRGKNYRKAFEQIDRTKTYTVKEGLGLTINSSPVKFDATVELHVRLGVDPKQADQNVRDIVVLPAGTGKEVRVAVLADSDGVEAAKKAGADVAGSEEFLQQLDKGQFNFDVLVATPSMMAKLGKYARQLGPKGLMPNPKSGTVTNDVAKAVSDAKAGRVEYRVDTTGIVHVGIGKVSFGADKLLENAKTILSSIKSNKPSSLKGSYIMSVYTSTTMGPSVPIDVSDASSF
jgi:ribosomal protein L1